ncbi:hypothetical protein BJY52DRAFT_773481 [Lactarius psammicola]|nr:hypothetical protein BJY52DRAFT_773481 [Lactarius psammicola]
MTPDAHQSALPLDEGLYLCDTTFFKQQTGINDDDELKTHLLTIQAEAYKVHPYPCIRVFSWASPGIEYLFSYQYLLKLSKEREEAILLDIGCCFGTDVRKAIADGFPLRNVVTTDLHKDFWDLGHRLFRTTPDTFPVTFVPGDVFDPEHLSIVPPFTTTSPPVTTVPDLRTLTSLNPLRGHVSAIYVGNFFHLFPKDAQLRLARALAGLLTYRSSMIFGVQVGLPEGGHPSAHHRLFCHTPQSWDELWDGEVFPKGTVKVFANVTELPRDENLYPEEDSVHVLSWLVVKL